MAHTTRRFAEWLGRLAAHADRRLVPAAVTALLLVDLLVGFNWLLSPRKDLTSPAYDTGERLMSLDLWGALFIILAAVSGSLFLAGGRKWLSGYTIGGLLAGLWGFWVVLFFVAPMGRQGASYTLAALALGMTLLHILTGLASLHRPTARELAGLR